MLISVTTMMWELLQYVRLSYADHLGLVCGGVFIFILGFVVVGFYMEELEEGREGRKGGKEEEEGRKKGRGREARKERRKGKANLVSRNMSCFKQCLLLLTGNTLQQLKGSWNRRFK